MAECNHEEVELTSWRGEAGYVRCLACNASSFVVTGWYGFILEPSGEDE